MWLFLAGAIATEVTATMALRASEGLRRRGWIPVIAVGYVAAFVLLSLGLASGLPLGVAYGIWAATGVALTAVLARLIFDEPLSLTMVFGILLIGAGVLLVEVGSAQ